METEHEGNRTLIHFSEISEVYCIYDEKWPIGESRIIKMRGAKKASHKMLEREANVLAKLDGTVGPRLIRQTGNSIEMERIGTHDLGDIMADLTTSDLARIIIDLLLDVNKLHTECGYVHRDIKPSNIMVKVQNNSQYKYSGLVDFGLSMRILKSQEDNERGGTEPWTHNSQKITGFRAHSGQDIFAVGMTILHCLVCGTYNTFQEWLVNSLSVNDTGVNLDKIFTKKVSKALYLFLQECITESKKGEDNWDKEFENLQSTFDELVALIDGYESLPKRELSFQKFSKKKPYRHDVLLVIDGTGSMKKEITTLRNTIKNVVDKHVKNIDIRIDIWDVGDYNSSNATVKPLGERLRRNAFGEISKRINANRMQGSEAEAYESALRSCYTTKSKNTFSAWNPRTMTTRTVILVGDSYPHGFVSSKCWMHLKNQTGRAWDRNTESHKPAVKQTYFEGDVGEISARYEKWERTHTHIKNWEEKEDRKAVFEAKNSNNIDSNFGGKGKIKADKNEAFDHRANFSKAIERIVTRKEATLHTIFAGNNLVSRSFMKYASLLGRGTYTRIEDGELEKALISILLSVDKSAFDVYKDSAGSEDTQVFDAITTFVADSTNGDTQTDLM